MTALQNYIKGPIEVLGMKKEEAEYRTLELLELVGLMDKTDEHLSRLSGRGGGSTTVCCNCSCISYETKKLFYRS